MNSTLKVSSIVIFGVLISITLPHFITLTASKNLEAKKQVETGHNVCVYTTDSCDKRLKFENNYNVDDVVKVTIVSMTTYGAFARIIPGIDGLIHISQIANKHIAKPQDELTVGQEVEAKITAIDDEKKRVSLSIRALLENNGEEAVEEAEVVEEATETVEE